VVAINTRPWRDEIVLLMLNACILGVMLLVGVATYSAVLPDERVDVLHHNYNGGGMEINGPAVLVRKSMTEQVSVAAHYLVDSVSAASIDVESFASPYTEERIETSVATDLLVDKTLYSVNLSTSDENDYTARTLGLSVSQDFFGDLTTLSLGFGRGWDEVGNVVDTSFAEDVDRKHFQLHISQILTTRWRAGIGFEAISDEGYLNNPYRPVRYIDTSSAKGWSTQAEAYPATRHSNALALSSDVALSTDQALLMQARYYTDTWGINGQSIETQYRYRWNEWVLSVKARYYQQDGADFYSDLFPFANAQNFLARDKELSTYSTVVLGAGVRFNFKPVFAPWIKRGELGLLVDQYMIDYDNFRDITVAGFVAGSEPKYSLSASLIRFNLVVWY